MSIKVSLQLTPGNEVNFQSKPGYKYVGDPQDTYSLANDQNSKIKCSHHCILHSNCNGFYVEGLQCNIVSNITQVQKDGVSNNFYEKGASSQINTIAPPTATESPASAPATDQASAPATDQASAPATDQASAPATDQASAPATDQASAPATDQASASASEPASAPAPAAVTTTTTTLTECGSGPSETPSPIPCDKGIIIVGACNMYISYEGCLVTFNIPITPGLTENVITMEGGSQGKAIPIDAKVYSDCDYEKAVYEDNGLKLSSSIPAAGQNLKFYMDVSMSQIGVRFKKLNFGVVNC